MRVEKNTVFNVKVMRVVSNKSLKTKMKESNRKNKDSYFCDLHDNEQRDGVCNILQE